MSSLKGFEAVSLTRKTGKAVMTVTPDSIRLNKSAVEELNFPEYIVFLINPDTQQFAVMRAKESDEDSMPLGVRPSYTASAHIDNPIVVTAVLKYFDLPSTDNEEEIPRASMRGVLSPKGDALIFDAHEADIRVTRKRGRKPHTAEAADVNGGQDGWNHATK
ncbi:resolvase family protein [Bifidobacterium dolichotidis]|uniref:Resolvase family protein n=1 Tax=Bifidobacterium dolichotidis TaxID=2306976 RepID=A0A430FRN4_9BIFI|nr:hypothetical protein [Bifidobacterium dolichotidis]RSX55524.1 resolvase family protein [Bifidobacterium dolichotidis]